MFLKIKRGKGAKFRRVPATQRLRREIIRYVNRYRPETKATNLLVQRDGRPVMVQTACNMLQRIRAKVGFPLHAHRFRHTFASDMVRAGVSLPALMQLMGHAQIQTTLVYMQVTPLEVYQQYARAVAQHVRPVPTSHS